MASDWNDQDKSHEFWYRGKVNRRHLLGWGAGTLGATILMPAPWRAAFGQAKPLPGGRGAPMAVVQPIVPAHPKRMVNSPGFPPAIGGKRRRGRRPRATVWAHRSSNCVDLVSQSGHIGTDWNR